MLTANTKLMGALAFAGAALAPADAVAPAPDAPLMACLPADPPAGAGKTAPGPAQAAPEAPELNPTQQVLVEHLARRYQIAAEPTGRIVETAFRAAEAAGLDPLLVLAVISVESRFNPIAESGMGARGLMQIIPKWHREKLAEHGGDEAVLDPESNIKVGTQILREYVRRTGSLEAGLQFYNGASWDDTARYTQRVMGEKRRLEDVVLNGRTDI